MGCAFCNPNQEPPKPHEVPATPKGKTPSVEIDGQSSILHDSEMYKLIRCCPAEVKFWPWKRIYQMTEDGNSLTTFHERTKKRKQTIMIIQTTENQIFGAFANQPWIPHASDSGYGDRQTFVWNLRELKKAKPGKKAKGKKTSTGRGSTFGTTRGRSMASNRSGSRERATHGQRNPTGKKGKHEIENKEDGGDGNEPKYFFDGVQHGQYDARAVTPVLANQPENARRTLSRGEARQTRTQSLMMMSGEPNTQIQVYEAMSEPTQYWKKVLVVGSPEVTISHRNGKRFESGPAILLGENFMNNATAPCLVFGSPNLCLPEVHRGTLFTVKNMELWVPRDFDYVEFTPTPSPGPFDYAVDADGPIDSQFRGAV